MATFLRFIFILVLVGILSITAFCRVCTGYQSRDDMGYVMVTVKTFLANHCLYDETYTQYGPAFYAYKQLMSWAGLPLSHDTTLLVTATTWMAAALLCAGYVARITRNTLLTGATLLAVAVMLQALKNEPGHPQEFCILLLSAALLSSSFIRQGRYPGAVLALMGFFVGLLGMTKPNLGIFAALALVLTISRMLPLSRTTKIFFRGCAVAALLLPVALMHEHLPEAAGYCLLVTAAVLFLILELRGSTTTEAITWASAAAAMGGAVAAVMAASIYALVTGTSVSGLVHGLILQHIGFERTFFVAPQFNIGGVILALGVSALVYVARQVAIRGCRQWPWIYGAITVSAIPFLVLAEKLTGVHGAFGYCLPAVAAIAGPRQGQHWALAEAGPRYFALALAVLSGLIGYPVWGSQGALSLFLLFPVWAVACADATGLSRVQNYAAAVQDREGAAALDETKSSRRKWRWLSASASVALLFGALLQAKAALGVYRAMEPLRLHGTRLLRMPVEQAIFYRRLVQATQAHGRALFSMPGLCSLYFWTNEEPPTCRNAAAWQILFDAGQQSRVIEDLERTSDLCVIRWPEASALWTQGRNVSQNRIVQYLDTNFVPVESIGQCEIMVRRKATALKSSD